MVYSSTVPTVSADGKNGHIEVQGDLPGPALERVRQSGEPILITRRGEPIAQVMPPPPPEQTGGSAFGCALGKMEVVGDIVSPLPEELWEALR